MRSITFIYSATHSIELNNPTSEIEGGVFIRSPHSLIFDFDFGLSRLRLDMPQPGINTL
jgi:hypothetical protein